jgi:hypothetical protein
LVYQIAKLWVKGLLVIHPIMENTLKTEGSSLCAQNTFAGVEEESIELSNKINVKERR